MSLHVVCGPMFSGKTTLAMQTVRRYRSVGTQVMIISHSSDTRYTQEGVSSHDRIVMDSHLCMALMPMLDEPEWNAAKVIVVEEAQFFPDLLDFCIAAVEHHKKTVFVYGLDGNYKRQAFGQILQLCSLADSFQKISAFCKLCQTDNTPGLFTASMKPMPQDGICVGGADVYAAVCRQHYLAVNEKNKV